MLVHNRMNDTSLGLVHLASARVIHQASGRNHLLLQYRSASHSRVGSMRDPWDPVAGVCGADGTSAIRPRGRGTLKL